jgi:hypothetical protein
MELHVITIGLDLGLNNNHPHNRKKGKKIPQNPWLT